MTDPVAPPDGDRATAMAPPTKVGAVGAVGTVLALVGVGLSTYLTVAHYSTTQVLACADSGVINCAKVTTSSYSMVLHVPVALLGLLFFVAMVPLQLPWAWRRGSDLVHRARTAMVVTGVAAVLWLVYVELFRLDAICLYCSGVHVVTVALFALTLIGNVLRAE